MTVRILQGDCRDVLATLPDASVDSIVTDPPAGIGFMGKGWDSDKGGRDQWIAWMQSVADECLRVLKPGGHALVWALPRTSHWTAMAWENAGFEVRDRVAHVFGSGFPKSLDVSKAIDKAAGAVREVLGVAGKSATKTIGTVGHVGGEYFSTAAATDAARQWSGWGTALKPAMEDWWLLRKPLISTVAANVLAFGTGALNIDGCRVGLVDGETPYAYPNGRGGEGWHGREGLSSNLDVPLTGDPLGRWPANLLHDGSDEVLTAFPQAPGQQRAVGPQHGEKASVNVFGDYGPRDQFEPRSDTGSAARFFKACKPDDASSVFYTAKASAYDRNDGTYDLPPVFSPTMGNGIGGREHDPVTATKKGNHHPTVKPTELMRYLCRLITPPAGTILDPFMGSGSTLKAAELEGFSAIGIEIDPAYVEIARRRIGSDFSLFVEIE